MRVLLKRSVEALLCGSGLTRVSRSRLGADVLVLAYHNIVPDGESAVGDASLHLSQRSFARQLDLLRHTHDIVPLEDALRAPAYPGRPRVVITFDDAYRGAVWAGVEELVRRALPATIFVAPAFVGGGTFWWDVLAGDAGLPDDVRRHGLERLQGRDARIRAWAAGRGIRERAVPEHQTVASEQELAEAARRPGITLGAHTWSHTNLASLHGAELEEELERPLAWLRERHAGMLPWISYPYGLHSPQVERAAAAAGYAGAFRVEGGWLPRPPERADHFLLPRLNVPAGLSIRGFELRTSGLPPR